jgi:hypothetical protein
MTVIFTGCGDGNDDGFIDLTAMSDTMVSSQLDIIAGNPDEYSGKTIKAKGEYLPFLWEGETEYRHYVTIDCPSGCDKYLEFILSGDRTYPADYPAQGKTILIEGTIDFGEKSDFITILVDDVVVM